jgi:hypothetical protein
MAIKANALTIGVRGSRLKEDTGNATGSPIGMLDLAGITGAIGGAAQPAPAPAAAPATPAVPNTLAATATISPALLAAALQNFEPARTLPFKPVPLPLPTPQSRTTTQLAQGAIDQLNGANPSIVREAINATTTTLRGQNLPNDGLMDYLERRVRVGEVLNQLARDWSDTTKADFAGAFSMGQDRLEAMDSIVSLAILNDRELEVELRAENTPQTTSNDLLQHRRVVWQYPEPGTVLTPPYLILIAVEYQDVARAEDAVKSIIGLLDTADGFKLPRTLIQRLPR